jgi:uncharacterized membrane protein
MIVKIKVDKTINNDNTNIVHLILTFKDYACNIREFKLQANSLAVRINGSNHINDIEFLVEQLLKNGLEPKICMFAKEVISAQELINNDKLLVGKAPAKKAPAKKKAV